jgi:lipopolysaccharide/colanic/teichoic acid biosynthesis glycosyltransferase
VDDLEKFKAFVKSYEEMCIKFPQSKNFKVTLEKLKKQLADKEKKWVTRKLLLVVAIIVHILIISIMVMLVHVHYSTELSENNIILTAVQFPMIAH